MSLNNTLANAMIAIKNASMIGKDECVIKPSSKLIKNVLTVLQKNKYIGDFEEIDDGKSGILRVKLIGTINNCRAISPRTAIKNDEIEQAEKRYLPSRHTGILILSTPQGVMTHKEAKEKKIGGRLLSYAY